MPTVTTHMMLTIAVVVSAAMGCSKADDKSKSKPVRKSPVAATTTIDLHDSNACKACHGAIVSEFEQSMHVRSHYARDPIFAGVRKIRMKKEGAAVAKACERCHQPDVKAKPTLNAGITCFACHNLHAGDKSVAAGLALVGPHNIAAKATPAHATGAAGPAFKDGRSLCLTCHAALSSPSGVAMCTTGPEHSEVMAKSDNTCVSCHMVRVKGAGSKDGKRSHHASHAFLGPHRAWYQNDPSFLTTAVKLSATLKPGVLNVHLANETGHAFPTGFPGRMALVRCSGSDAAGKVVWTCTPRRLGKIYLNAKGKKTLAPYAVKLASDTRLKAGGVGDYSFSPPANVVRVEVSLLMRLLPPGLAKKIGLKGSVEDQPKLITKVVVP